MSGAKVKKSYSFNVKLFRNNNNNSNLSNENKHLTTTRSKKSNVNFISDSTSTPPTTSTPSTLTIRRPTTFTRPINRLSCSLENINRLNEMNVIDNKLNRRCNTQANLHQNYDKVLGELKTKNVQNQNEDNVEERKSSFLHRNVSKHFSLLIYMCTIHI